MDVKAFLEGWEESGRSVDYLVRWAETHFPDDWSFGLTHTAPYKPPLGTGPITGWFRSGAVMHYGLGIEASEALANAVAQWAASR